MFLHILNDARIYYIIYHYITISFHILSIPNHVLIAIVFLISELTSLMRAISTRQARSFNALGMTKHVRKHLVVAKYNILCIDIDNYRYIYIYFK